MAHSPDPHTTDAFWMKFSEEKLLEKTLTKNYRKRLENIYLEAWKRETKSNIGLHYPNDRK